MNLSLDFSLGAGYTSPSQQTRVITESWFLREGYCPNCGNNLNKYGDNKPVADFYCLKCTEDFELKSKKAKIGKKVSAGSYEKMISRISSSTRPNFFFLAYLKSLDVNDLMVVPKHFFINELIEKRQPLAITAKRAGWIGSNLLFSRIPRAGQILYVQDGKEVPKRDVMEKWKKTVFLKEIKKSEAKGWILDIINCLDDLNKREFTLVDIYNYEGKLSQVHPTNKNIKAKIRQQLQILRDQGYLKFLGEGRYRLS